MIIAHAGCSGETQTLMSLMKRRRERSVERRELLPWGSLRMDRVGENGRDGVFTEEISDSIFLKLMTVWKIVTSLRK